MKWLALNDVHIGTSHIHPSVTYNRLRDVVYPLLEKIDLLTIGGDFFDNAFYVDDSASLYGNLILHDFVRLGAKYGFSIRVLRGTYTHDRDQLKIMEGLASKYPELDFKYFTDIGADKIGKYTFLYLPDNLSYDADHMQDNLPSFIHEEIGEGEVDFVVGHGFFKHALPDILIKNGYKCYDAEKFRNFVKRIVVMGHVHESSNYKDFVYYTGSFDRDRHGEEEPKGCMLISVTEDCETVSFIPNLEATLHLTYKLTKSTIEENIVDVKQYIEEKFDTGSHGYLRIVGNEQRLLVKQSLMELYRQRVTITDMDVHKAASNHKDTLGFDFKVYHSDIPSREGLAQALKTYLDNHVDGCTVTVDDIERSLNELEDT